MLSGRNRRWRGARVSKEQQGLEQEDMRMMLELHGSTARRRKHDANIVPVHSREPGTSPTTRRTQQTTQGPYNTLMSSTTAAHICGNTTVLSRSTCECWVRCTTARQHDAKHEIDHTRWQYMYTLVSLVRPPLPAANSRLARRSV